MALPLYLARTMAEMAENFASSNMAYMACHFSPGGQGLSNLPDHLPPGTMLILDDSTPMDCHDPEVILKQLSAQVEQHGCDSVLLDFQRPEIPGQQELAALLVASLPRPVGVSALYAQDLNCPLFLPPVPPDRLLSDYLAPWQGREIWLEAARDGLILTLTEQGCSAVPLFDCPDEGIMEEKLRIHYAIETATKAAIFRLWRTQEDLDNLLIDAEKECIAKVIGLWQELH